MLISFEGIDGCGKTTQIEMLREQMENRSEPVAVFREPGGTRLSERIRQILLESDMELDAVSETLLFSAARSRLVQEKVKPLLEQGATVLLDRFYDSTIAYQGFGRGRIDLDDLHRLNRMASHELQPDLTFYLRIDARTALERRGEIRADRMEQAGQAFYERVIEGFEHLARQEKRFVVLDGSASAQAVHRQVNEQVMAAAGKR